MENTAIYVLKSGTDEEPKSSIGLCPIQSVPSGPRTVYIVESPQAEKIYGIACAAASLTMERPSLPISEFDCTAREAAMSLVAACEVDIIGSPPFEFRVRRDWVF